MTHPGIYLQCRLAWIACLVFVIAGISSVPQVRRNSFSITISAPQTTVEPDTPIRLDIQITNQSKSLLVLGSSRNGDADSFIIIRNSLGEPVLSRRETTGDRPVSGSRFGITVEPNKSQTEAVDINRWFNLTKGVYSVQVRRPDRQGVGLVESNKIGLTVK